MEARLRLCLGPYTRAIYTSLKAEASQPAPGKGTARVALTRDGSCVEIVITAKDLAGLRALTNSYLLLSHAAYSSLWAVGEGQG